MSNARRAAVALRQRKHISLLVCPETGQPLEERGDELVTPDGTRRYPIVRGIPRFVGGDEYATGFSLQWSIHNRTQLDSFQGQASSSETLTEKTGLTEEQVRGKLVLDAGIGAGRFTDVLLRWGADVVGVDLSFAVESAQETFGHLPQLLVAQADIGRLPFREGTFDHIVSIGVLHHTPNTEAYFHKLPRLLKPGGEIAIWVYPDEGDYVVRDKWIPFTNRIPDRWYHSFCKVFVPWALARRESRFVRIVQRVFPISDQGLGVENDILNTFDGYSPRYHGIHSPGEVRDWFVAAGLSEIREFDWHTAVRGRRAA